MNITQKQKGILFMILSALSFASMQVVVRLSREIPTMEQICVRNLFILIVSFFIIRKKHGSYYGPKKYQPYLFGRSFFGFLGLITLFYASSHAAQGDVTVLNKLSPIFVTLLAAVFMKEKLSPIQIPALVLSVLGAFIVFRPSFQSDPFPLIVALLSAITSGIAYTFLGYFKGKADGITVIALPDEKVEEICASVAAEGEVCVAANYNRKDEGYACVLHRSARHQLRSSAC